MPVPATTALRALADDRLRELRELVLAEAPADEPADRACRTADGERGVGAGWIEVFEQTLGPRSPACARRCFDRRCPRQERAGHAQSARRRWTAPRSALSPGVPTATSHEPPPRSTTATESGGSLIRLTAPCQASRPSSSALEDDDGRAGGLRRARRTSSSPFSAWRPGAVTIVSSRSTPALRAHPREALGDLARLLELLGADPAQPVRVVAETQVHALPVRAPSRCRARLPRRGGASSSSRRR